MRSGTPAGLVFKCLDQDSNLDLDLRRVLCDPLHSESIVFHFYLMDATGYSEVRPRSRFSASKQRPGLSNSRGTPHGLVGCVAVIRPLPTGMPGTVNSRRHDDFAFGSALEAQAGGIGGQADVITFLSRSALHGGHRMTGVA